MGPDRNPRSIAFSLLLALALFCAGAGRPAVAAPTGTTAPAAAADSADATAPPAPALPAVTGPDRVLSVSTSGLETVDTTLVLSTFQVKPGDVFRTQAIRDGIRALYRLQLFDQIEVNGEPTALGLNLGLRLVESPRISAVEFNGNRAIGSDKLQEKIAGTTGRVAGHKTLQEVTAKLDELYREEGYPRAEVHGDYLPAEKHNERILTLVITEGARIKVTAIRFTGNASISADKLRGQMDTRQKGFFRSGRLMPDKLEADMDKIRTYYQRNGFRDVRIADYQVKYADDNRTAEIEIAVDEGPPYTMSGHAIEGNSVLSLEQLEKLVRFGVGDRYNREKIDRTAGDIGAAYADRGYLYAQVDPDERLDSTQVFVTYRVVEQEPSRIRYIEILGNTRTKERVIRRQLYVFPGRKFDRELLVRSQRELFQLGYFQDVAVDFRPLPGSYDVDLMLKVEEKSVGTASGGAGYSSQGGLTGFLELGHPNLFGNGQAITLRLEKGSRVSNFEFSFTEPWLFNTPTTLGFDLYHNTITQDLYEVKRTGGALRLSRPVPGMPYTRVYGTYSFERTDGWGRYTLDETPDTTDYSPGSAYTDSTRVISRVTSTPNPVQFDPSGRSTSSLTIALTRNSTDHPVYPRAGAITSLTTEVAGGLLQGDVSYQKLTLDSRMYFKALSVPKFTKPAVLFRLQAGGISFNTRGDPVRVGSAPAPGEADDRLFTIESLELFRLGGTGRNALRGYDDYEVVPEENLRRRVVVSTDTTFTYDTKGTVTGIDTTVTTHTVYDTYPGGRFFTVLTLERQFTIADPLHGVFFVEAGGVWNKASDFSLSDIRRSAGVGLRMEIPLLGQVGFDYAYGFDRLNRNEPGEGGGRYNRGGWHSHFQFGRFF